MHCGPQETVFGILFHVFFLRLNDQNDQVVGPRAFAQPLHGTKKKKRVPKEGTR